MQICPQAQRFYFQLCRSSAFKFFFPPYFVSLSFTFYSFSEFSSLCLQAPSVQACCPLYPLEHTAYALQLFNISSLLIPTFLLHCVWFWCLLYFFKLFFFCLLLYLVVFFFLFVLDMHYWIKNNWDKEIFKKQYSLGGGCGVYGRMSRS